ncbi:MAG: RNA methyltransferase [Halobacteriales archaeon]|nr:RNA methyltransferase [Halobacteriales archaeon]
MPRFVVVLVKPKFEGNLGATARVLRNFGIAELWLVAPEANQHRDEARKYAMHAWDVLEQARTFDTLADAVKELDLVVGTASDVASNEKRDYLRMPLRLREFAPRAWEVQGTVGLVFGPEDHGLSNEDLERCDLLVTIPTAPEHPSLNLSHAVAVVCYELTEQRHHVKRPRVASREDQELMLHFLDRILQHLEVPEHRQRTTRLSFQRMLGRAMMSRWEYHRLMGVFNGALRAMEALHAQGRTVKGSPKVKPAAHARKARSARKR